MNEQTFTEPVYDDDDDYDGPSLCESSWPRLIWWMVCMGFGWALACAVRLFTRPRTSA